MKSGTSALPNRETKMTSEAHPTSLARSLTHSHVLRAHGLTDLGSRTAAAISHSAILFQISRCHDGPATTNRERERGTVRFGGDERRNGGTNEPTARGGQLLNMRPRPAVVRRPRQPGVPLNENDFSVPELMVP